MSTTTDNLPNPRDPDACRRHAQAEWQMLSPMARSKFASEVAYVYGRAAELGGLVRILRPSGAVRSSCITAGAARAAIENAARAEYDAMPVQQRVKTTREQYAAARSVMVLSNERPKEDPSAPSRMAAALIWAQRKNPRQVTIGDRTFTSEQEVASYLIGCVERGESI